MKIRYLLIVLILSSCSFGGQSKDETPTASAVSFLSGLRKLLLLERQNPKEAKEIKSNLTKRVSDYNLISALAGMGLKLRDIPQKKIDKVRETYVTNWEAVINFYKQNIQFHKLEVLGPTTTTSTKPVGMVSLLVPASRPGYPRTVNILVTCVRENNQWKIQLIRLFPPASK